MVAGSHGTRPESTGRVPRLRRTRHLPRVVSKWVLLGTSFPEPPNDREKNSLGGPTLMGRDDVSKWKEFLHGGFKTKKPRR